MHLSERAILTPRLVILAGLILLGVGAVAVLDLPKEMEPRVKLPVIIVAVPYPGASPEVIEREIVRRIEDASPELENLRTPGGILSQAVDGVGVVQFVFDHGIDVDQAKKDVESLVNRVKGEFPDRAQQDPGPVITDIAFDEMPIIQVFVSEGVDGRHRRKIAEDLQDRIEDVSGVAAVNLFGGDEREVQIEVGPHVMALYGFTHRQVAEAVAAANQESAGGRVEGGDGSDQRVQVRSKFADLEEIRNLALNPEGANSILLREVAEVSFGAKPRQSIARYGGREAVVLSVQPKTDVDVMSTTKQIQSIVDQFVASGENEGTTIGTVRSQARFIGYMLTQLGESAGWGMLLVVGLLWVFLGWRNAGLISISVPFAILGMAAFMWFAKRTVAEGLAINTMTLFATILVIGMVVDGCIIVGENIYRHRQLGRPPVEAARRGINEVGGSLMSAYLTTFAAFAPMFLVTGVMGDYMQLLPIVVLFALCSAMLVDHFLLPVLSVYIMKPRRGKLGEDDLLTLEPDEENRTVEDLEIRNAERHVQGSWVARVYGRMIRYALHDRGMVLALAAISIATPVGLFASGAIGRSFFPESDMPIIEVTFDVPLGSSMEKRTAEVARILEEAVYGRMDADGVVRGGAVREHEWYRPSERSERVKPVTTMGQADELNTNIGSGAGSGPEFGMIYIELVLAEDRSRSAREIREAIVEKIESFKRTHPEAHLLAGLNYKVESPQEGPPAGADVVLRVLGQEATNMEMLGWRAREVEHTLRSIPGTVDITSDHRVRPQLDAVPNTQLLTLYDVKKRQVGEAVGYALEGVEYGEVDFGSDEVLDIRIRNKEEFRDDFDDLESLPLIGTTGKRVTVGEVAEIRPQRKANVIRRYDRQRVINLRCSLGDGIATDQVRWHLVESLNPQLDRFERAALDTGANERTVFRDDQLVVEFGGETEIRDDAFEDLSIAGIVALGAMLIVLVFKFNSFRQAIIVLGSVPISLVGVFIGLTVTGFDFSVSAMIGVVALAGIVVNDAIVLVDFINRMKQTGISMERAVVYAGQLRIRPIFLTTITTISGMLPLALNVAGGGEFWQPLTVTVMFGLGFATLLQLFIIPIACYTFDRSDKKSLLDPATHPALSVAAPPPPAH